MNTNLWDVRPSLARVMVIVGVLVLVGFGYLLGSAFAPVTAQDPTYILSEMEQAYADLFAQVSPSVVAIEVDQRGRTENEFFPYSGGSGFVLNEEGHIVTNFHVVDGGDRIAVNFLDGTIVRAQVIGLDPDADVAVLKVNLPAEQLDPITFGNPDDLRIGQTALAIGSPFGERWTLTAGIISALNRRIDGLDGYQIGGVIQTDAAINPGNSGGPLFNLAGEVIGINSQIVSQTRSNSGVGFAVPSDLVQRVVADLIDKGEVEYSYLGINGEDVNLSFIEQYSLPNNLRGVVITRLERGSPADESGVLEQSSEGVDIVTAINGQPIFSMSTLIGYLSSETIPGDEITLTVWRAGQLIDIEITLGARR
ncbi:MAG: trypsin-like peptidase domain-containing protein [bacterium]|nr:trypsin-like peptidase domain-containing protein [bacterium]